MLATLCTLGLSSTIALSATASSWHGQHGLPAGAVAPSAALTGGGTAIGSAASTLLPPTADQSIYVSPQFFGQHLMFYWGLTPRIPVHAMRLASSNTDWCEMDSGTSSNQYNF